MIQETTRYLLLDYKNDFYTGEDREYESLHFSEEEYEAMPFKSKDEILNLIDAKGVKGLPYSIEKQTRYIKL